MARFAAKEVAGTKQELGGSAADITTSCFHVHGLDIDGSVVEAQVEHPGVLRGQSLQFAVFAYAIMVS